MTAGEGRRLVDVEERGAATVLRIHNPPVNVLTLEVIDALDTALADLAAREAPVVVLRGSTETGFSAGVDVAAHAPDQVARMLRSFHGAIRRLWALDAVSVAVVEGRALGGGCELAMACDLVVAEDGAALGQPEIDLACFPPVATAVLPARIGVQRATEMVLLGRPVSAAQAEAWGLVNRRAPAAGLDGVVDEIVGALAGKSRIALALARRALATGWRRQAEAALDECEALYLDELAGTADMAEGVAAFLERRRPRWTDA